MCRFILILTFHHPHDENFPEKGFCGSPHFSKVYMGNVVLHGGNSCWHWIVKLKFTKGVELKCSHSKWMKRKRRKEGRGSMKNNN